MAREHFTWLKFNGSEDALHLRGRNTNMLGFSFRQWTKHAHAIIAPLLVVNWGWLLVSARRNSPLSRERTGKFRCASIFFARQKTDLECGSIGQIRCRFFSLVSFVHFPLQKIDDLFMCRKKWHRRTLSSRPLGKALSRASVQNFLFPFHFWQKSTLLLLT